MMNFEKIVEEMIEQYDDKNNNRLLLAIYMDTINVYCNDNISDIDRHNRTIFIEKVFPALLSHPLCNLKKIEEQILLMHICKDDLYAPSLSFLLIDEKISKETMHKILDQFMWNALIPISDKVFKRNNKYNRIYKNEEISWIQFMLLENYMIGTLIILNYDTTSSMNLINSRGESVWHILSHAVTEQYSRNNKKVFDYLHKYSQVSILTKDKSNKTALELLNHYLELMDTQHHSKNWFILKKTILKFIINQFSSMELKERLDNDLNKKVADKKTAKI